MIIVIGAVSPLILLFSLFCFGYFIYWTILIIMVLLFGYTIYRIFFAKQKHYKLPLNESLVRQIEEQQQIDTVVKTIVHNHAFVKTYQDGKFK